MAFGFFCRIGCRNYAYVANLSADTIANVNVTLIDGLQTPVPIWQFIPNQTLPVGGSWNRIGGNPTVVVQPASGTLLTWGYESP